jgi:hypothetical protein
MAKSFRKPMKILTVIALLALALVPVVVGAQTPNITGNWNATFTMTAPDGRTQSITFTFHFTQKGKVLTGTIGPTPERQWKVEKGVVDGIKVTFQVQQPEGPTLRTFALTYVKDRLQGTQKLQRGDQTAEVTEAERAKGKE